MKARYLLQLFVILVALYMIYWGLTQPQYSCKRIEPNFTETISYSNCTFGFVLFGVIIAVFLTISVLAEKYKIIKS